VSTLAVGLAFALLLQAGAPSPVTLTAKSANVADPGVGVKVNILRWSTEDERKPVVAALDPEAQKAAAKTASAGARAGRGALDPNDPALADLAAASGRGGRGGGRGGRGGRGGDAPPPDPIALLTGALGKAPTVGYLWTNEIVGYSIKYAARFPSPGGGERIILLTDRRLGGGTVGWKFVGAGTPTDYEFTLIELRLDAKGAGEGKASLTSKVILDKEAGTLALENYAATPAIFQNVRR
jgi:hypothetical protein